MLSRSFWLFEPDSVYNRLILIANARFQIKWESNQNPKIFVAASLPMRLLSSQEDEIMDSIIFNSQRCMISSSNNAAFSSCKDLQALKESFKKPVEPSKKKHRSNFEETKQALKQLKKTYPVAFNANKPLPLALGAAKEIAKNLPELAAPILRLAMAIWTKQAIYLQAVIVGGDRYNLDGSVSGAVQESEKEYSQKMLNRKHANKRQDVVVFWVYILECSNGAFYTGWTNDLEKRYRDHCEGNGAKYTRSFKPVRIAQKWQFGSQSLAMQAEAQIKKLSLKDKKKIIDKPSLFTILQ